MSREEFHALYAVTPPGFRAELIGGTVFAPSPLSRAHATMQLRLAGIIAIYEAATPGIEAGDNGTVILADDSEPQPDLYLRALPECGGATTVTRRDGEDDADYILGPPEMLVEIAYSSRAIDLNGKREDYSRYGVREYLVISLRESRIHWFDFAANEEPPLPSDGVIRSRVFPGLWIDSAALFAGDPQTLHATARAGIESAEHAEFVLRLAGRRQ